MARFLVLNGPNLNLLGNREPEIYGHETLADVERACAALCTRNGDTVQFFQSNAEHELVERIHFAATDNTDFVIFNPGAYTHTSIALRDALLATGLRFVEIHLSNIFSRESFRHRSYLSDIATGVICGLGTQGYLLALAAARQLATGTGEDRR